MKEFSIDVYDKGIRERGNRFPDVFMKGQSILKGIMIDSTKYAIK